MPDDARPAVAVWNAMGGQIDWTALEILAEIHGITDIPLLVEHLVAIRNHHAPKPEEE